MIKDTGGAAFPYVADADFDYGTGMNLRDYFAAKVLQANMSDGVHEDHFLWSASRAYKMADEMLKARKL